MARNGNALERAVVSCDAQLLEDISDHADQVYGHALVHDLVVDPQPRDFVVAALHLKIARENNDAPPLPRAVVVGAFQWLIPEYER